MHTQLALTPLLAFTECTRQSTQSAGHNSYTKDRLFQQQLSELHTTEQKASTIRKQRVRPDSVSNARGSVLVYSIYLHRFLPSCPDETRIHNNAELSRKGVFHFSETNCNVCNKGSFNPFTTAKFKLGLSTHFCTAPPKDELGTLLAQVPTL